jgi:hypothetical protein
MTFYRRNLPHIEKPGKSYFITFNTIDDFMLPDPAKSLVFFESLPIRSQEEAYAARRGGHAPHAHLILTPLANEGGTFRLAENHERD